MTEDARSERPRQERLRGKTIAILATDGFEQAELEKPKQAFEAEGATVVVISPKRGKIQGFHHRDRGHLVEVNQTISEADPSDYDALVLPGGALNPDALRLIPEAVLFVRAFSDTARPIAAICHAPWLLIEADLVRNRTVTSWPSLRTDLENAGARWVDEAVVADGGLVTSRKPADIPEFVEKAIEEFAAARNEPPKSRPFPRRPQKAGSATGARQRGTSRRSPAW